jgi:ATP-dependent RNA helicase RhlE
VLVFTRTKFGANNVAEFLEKNGITAMALHGNKSQAARTQALAGFKSGDVRALVATDIAARGIDIDDLPHVVNYEIPNVSEDYVHRIGRTGRAGADGAAVNLVCMDEEGFMQDIERFTKQNIEVKFVEGFGPEPGEKAEPIAMGRQTIWGGAGKPPSRDVMQAAAKAARTEMMQRVREKKTNEGAGGGRGGNGGGQGSGRGRTAGSGGGGQGGNRSRDSGEFQPPRPQGARPPQGQGRGRQGGMGGGVSQPAGFANEPRAPRAPAGQPDPMRTSVDLMAERGARRGNFGGNRNGGGGGGGYGGGGGGGGGGFGGGGRGGNGPRGPRGPGGNSSR